jgi:hypothetical protein
MENVKHIVLRAINAVNGIRDAVYLDTNAWSSLAKHEIDPGPLAQWVERNCCFVWLARMQLAELSARREIIEGLADVLGVLGVLLIDYGQNDFSGKPWNLVQTDLHQYIRLNTPELKAAFVKEFAPPALEKVREQLRNDGDAFGRWLEDSVAAIPASDSRDWQTFPHRLRLWIRQMCAKNGHAIDERALEDPRCYAGLRLGYAVLFVRYVINDQRWKPADFLDYLHAADMAYAKVAVTERNLAECIRQALRRPEVTGPELAVPLSWLQNPGVWAAAG